MKEPLRLALATLLGTVAVVSSANAAGFYLQEQSTTAMGSAFAGAGAEARDASIMYYNPAGITQLKKAQINGNLSVLKAWESNHDTGSTSSAFNGTPTPTVIPAGGGTSDDAIPVTPLPALYAATPLPVLDDKLWVGVGLSVPFGLSTKYDNDWFGRFDSIKSELTVLDIQPTIAYQATDWLSIGGGVNIQRAIARLTSAVTNTVSTGESTLKGNDWDVGYNLGVMLKPTDGTTIGLDYRTKVDHTLKGHVIVTGVPSAFGGAVPGANENSAASADLNLPNVYGVSISQKVAPEWKVLGQVNYFQWSRFDNITAVRSNGTVAESISEDYRNTFSYAIGAEYAWRPDTTFRFGYQYDETPTHSPNRDTRVPDGNRNNFAVGVSHDFTPHLTLDLSASYSLMADSNVSVARNHNLATINANRDDTSFAFGSVGLTYKF